MSTSTEIDRVIKGFYCIYKHPGGPIKDLKNFRHKLEQNLLLINSEKKQCIITGDLNIDGLKIKTNSEVENFFNMLLEHNFLPTITNPTRIVNNSELHISLIDHVLINSQVVKNSAKVSSGNIYSDIRNQEIFIFNTTKAFGQVNSTCLQKKHTPYSRYQSNISR